VAAAAELAAVRGCRLKDAVVDDGRSSKPEVVVVVVVVVHRTPVEDAARRDVIGGVLIGPCEAAGAFPFVRRASPADDAACGNDDGDGADNDNDGGCGIGMNAPACKVGSRVWCSRYC